MEMTCINEIVCPKLYPYKKLNTKQCINCPVYYKNKCQEKCPIGKCISMNNKELNICEDEKPYTKNINGFCINNLQELYYNYTLNNASFFNYSNIIVKINDLEEEIFNYQISNYSNLPHVNMERCYQLLREFYKLEPDVKLYLFNIYTPTFISNNAFNDYYFEVHRSDSGEEVDLKPCKNRSTDKYEIFYPVNDLNLINYENGFYYHKLGYDIYLKSSNFYNDFCISINKNNNDIVISDRKLYIFPNNLIFCPESCEFQRLDFENKGIICICNGNFMEYSNYE